MPVLPEGPLFRASHSSLFSAQHAPCPQAQVQALLHFLIDQLKLFLIGCVPIATKGCDILRPLLDGSLEAVLCDVPRAVPSSKGQIAVPNADFSLLSTRIRRKKRRPHLRARARKYLL